MALGLLARLASFSLKNPKSVITIVVVLALGAFAIHYKLLVGERDKLRVAEEGYKQAVAAFQAREATLHEDLLIERAAAVTALAERNEARRSVAAFREGRSDQPSIDWARLAIPEGESSRLCEALPEMDGCQNTPPNN